MSDVDQQAKDELAAQEAAMEAEFSGTDPQPAAATEAPADPTPAPTQDDAKQTDQPQGDQPAVDPAKPEDQSAAAAPQPITVEQFNQLKTELFGEIKKINGAVGGLKGYVQNLSKKAAVETTAAGGDTPSAAQVAKAMKDADEYAKMKAEYPQWGEAMDKQMGVLKDFILDSLPKGMDESSINSLVSQKVQGQMDEFVTNFNHAQWSDAHPQWQQDINSAPFAEWIGKQLPEIQALADSQNYRDGLKLLGKFYEHKKSLDSAQPQSSQQQQQRDGKQQRDKRLAAAVSPTDGNARGSGAQAQLSEEDAMEQEFAKHRH